MGSALSLARQGFTDITVWEQAPYLEEVGAGINIPPNLSRILTRWGVMDICKAEGVTIERANVLGALTAAGRQNPRLAQAGFAFSEHVLTP